MNLSYSYTVEKRVGNKIVREARTQTMTIPHDAEVIELDLSRRLGPAPNCDVKVKLPDALDLTLRLPDKPEA
jgi:hypothetical protein